MSSKCLVLSEMQKYSVYCHRGVGDTRNNPIFFPPKITQIDQMVFIKIVGGTFDS